MGDFAGLVGGQSDGHGCFLCLVMYLDGESGGLVELALKLLGGLGEVGGELWEGVEDRGVGGCGFGGLLRVLGVELLDGGERGETVRFELVVAVA